MTRTTKRLGCFLIAFLMLLLCLYSTMCIIQAGSIFVGERADWNLRFWGPIAMLGFAGSVFFGVYAIRLGLRSGESSS